MDFLAQIVSSSYVEMRVKQAWAQNTLRNDLHKVNDKAFLPWFDEQSDFRSHGKRRET